MAKELTPEEIKANRRRSIAQAASKRSREVVAEKKALRFKEDEVRRELGSGVVTINGVRFDPHPEIGRSASNNPNNCEVCYLYDYVAAAKDIAAGKVDQLSLYREFIKTDLWFVFYFIVKPFSDEAGMKMANSPFAVKYAREIEEGPKDFTLDLVAREHFKTTLMTIAETIQFIVTNPESSTGIFSYAHKQATKFLGTLKDIFQRETFLRDCCADVIWNDCEREAPLWSRDEGIVLRRKTTRKEPTVGPYGLIEGMPTGLHFERMIFDDISTEDTAESFDQMEKIKMKFDSAQNLGKEGGHHRVIGTFYHHNDPLVYVRDKKDLDGLNKYSVRFKPATEDGTATGRPVMISQKRLDDLRITKTFACQQLLDPTPQSEQSLNPDFLKMIERRFIPKRVYRFMLIDQAGDQDSNKRKDGDSWAMGVFAVEPVRDSLGQSNIFIENLWIEPSNESEAIEQGVRMYIQGGIIAKLGVEKVGQTTTHIHIANALKAKGRNVVFSDDKWTTGKLLRPAGRNKRKFIESAVSWPLNNGKWHYSSDVPTPYIDRLKMEMKNFPMWHDDGLNICAYLYDVIQEYNFPAQEAKPRPLRMVACPI